MDFVYGYTSIHLFSVVIIGIGSVFVYLRVIGLAKGECRVREVDFVVTM